MSQIDGTSIPKHIISLHHWGREQFEAVMDAARAMPPGGTPILRPVTIGMQFFEDSMRTRASFRTAVEQYGGRVIDITEANKFSVGETLLDAVLTLEAMGIRFFVLRTGDPNAPFELAADLHICGSLVRVISAGHGTHGHPTQVLGDLWALTRRLGTLAGRKIVLVGDLLHSRVARDAAWCYATMGADVWLAGPRHWLPSGWPGTLSLDSLGTVLPGADVVMTTRPQSERHMRRADRLACLEMRRGEWEVSPELLDRVNPTCLVLAPGPVAVGMEMSRGMMLDQRCLYREQVQLGMQVRSGLIWLMGKRLVRDLVSA